MAKDVAWFNWAVLIVGILMLGQNLEWWAFWLIEPWTAVFILWAVYKLVK